MNQHLSALSPIVTDLDGLLRQLSGSSLVLFLVHGDGQLLFGKFSPWLNFPQLIGLCPPFADALLRENSETAVHLKSVVVGKLLCCTYIWI